MQNSFEIHTHHGWQGPRSMLQEKEDHSLSTENDSPALVSPLGSDPNQIFLHQ